MSSPQTVTAMQWCLPDAIAVTLGARAGGQAGGACEHARLPPRACAPLRNTQGPRRPAHRFQGCSRKGSMDSIFRGWSRMRSWLACTRCSACICGWPSWPAPPLRVGGGQGRGTVGSGTQPCARHNSAHAAGASTRAGASSRARRFTQRAPAPSEEAAVGGERHRVVHARSRGHDAVAPAAGGRGAKAQHGAGAPACRWPHRTKPHASGAKAVLSPTHLRAPYSGRSSMLSMVLPMPSWPCGGVSVMVSGWPRRPQA
jgi:hypothetical protein